MWPWFLTEFQNDTSTIPQYRFDFSPGTNDLATFFFSICREKSVYVRKKLKKTNVEWTESSRKTFHICHWGPYDNAATKTVELISFVDLLYTFTYNKSRSTRFLRFEYWIQYCRHVRENLATYTGTIQKFPVKFLDCYSFTFVLESEFKYVFTLGTYFSKDIMVGNSLDAHMCRYVVVNIRSWRVHFRICREWKEQPVSDALNNLKSNNLWQSCKKGVTVSMKFSF